MPPIKRFTKEEIIDTTFEIVKKEGFQGVNARRIAKTLGCSVQPIFHTCKSMEELKKEVYKKIHDLYKKYMLKNKSGEKIYKQQGLSYIKFASDYPEFFKILFMQPSHLEAKEFIGADSTSEEIIKAGQKLTGFSYEEQKRFHVRVWIFTHGLACLVVNNTITLKEKEIETLLEDSVRQMLIGYKKEGEKNEKNN